MPDRHESTRLREEQEEHPIEDGQRLLEQQFGSGAATLARERLQEQLERVENAGAERIAHGGAMTSALIDGAIQQAGSRSEGFSTADLPEQEKGGRVVRQQREVELE